MIEKLNRPMGVFIGLATRRMPEQEIFQLGQDGRNQIIRKSKKATLCSRDGRRAYSLNLDNVKALIPVPEEKGLKMYGMGN